MKAEQGAKGQRRKSIKFVVMVFVPILISAIVFYQTPETQAGSSIKFQPAWLWTEEQYPGEDNIEDYVFELVNKERQKNNLPAYKKDDSLLIAARQHSQEMIDLKYFSHDSPKSEWKEPYQRAYCAGFFEAFVGENIAYNFGENDRNTAKNLMETWLKSAGHRANILSKKYTHLGVGVAKTRKNYGGYDYDYYYATQVFARKFFDYGALDVTEDEYFYVLSGTAAPLQTFHSVRVMRDEGEVDEKPADAGKTFLFSVKVKKNSGKHKIGLFPGTTVKYQFFLDADKPLNEVFVPRFYEY